jgi:glycosyltransferase involved in cell wall biosynthesis
MKQTSPREKVAIVIQRYGPEVNGGAEAHARLIAQRFQADLGYDVEVFTTTAHDYMTWDSHYPVGTILIDQVPVHRFAITKPRQPNWGYFDRGLRLLMRIAKRIPVVGEHLQMALEWLWVDLQGPHCPTLVAELIKRKSEFKKIFFFAYLYYPTLHAMKALKGKAVLIPLLHNEPPAYFEIVKQMLQTAEQLVFNTDTECKLAQSIVGKLNAKHLDIAGIGMDSVGELHVPPAALKFLEGKKYLLYLGRVSKSKGVRDLIEWFNAWKRATNNQDMLLVLGGSKDESVSDDLLKTVNFLGFVTNEERAYLMTNCFAVVNPSQYESLSMLLLEGLIAHKPVLARRECQVFQDYAPFAPSIHLISDTASFSEGINKFLTTPPAALSPKIEASAKWVNERFSWKRSLEILAKHIKA